MTAEEVSQAVAIVKLLCPDAIRQSCFVLLMLLTCDASHSTDTDTVMRWNHGLHAQHSVIQGSMLDKYNSKDNSEEAYKHSMLEVKP